MASLAQGAEGSNLFQQLVIDVVSLLDLLLLSRPSEIRTLHLLFRSGNGLGLYGIFALDHNTWCFVVHAVLTVEESLRGLVGAILRVCVLPRRILRVNLLVHARVYLLTHPRNFEW